jgi:hypothetical protein
MVLLQKLTVIYLPVTSITKNLRTLNMDWKPISDKPTGFERRVLLWLVWPEDEILWPAPPEAVIGWWKHGPACFTSADIENADHLVTHWCEITEPTK